MLVGRIYQYSWPALKKTIIWNRIIDRILATTSSVVPVFKTTNEQILEIKIETYYK